MSNVNYAYYHEKCTVMICSCDNYSDLWEPFFKLFEYYWNDCPFDILLNTETKKYSYSTLSIKCLQLYEANKNITYGKRMIDHLKKIKTPYTLILMDDFFIRKKVDTSEILKIINWLEKDSKAVVFNMLNLDDKYNKPSQKYEAYDLRPPCGNYKYNFQASVWKTEYLLKSWRKSDTPWTWECYGNYRSFNKKYNFYTINKNATVPIDYGYRNEGMGIYRGKWVVDTVKDLFSAHNISVDFEKRGIYKPEHKNITRMQNGKSNTFVFAKSIGLMRYFSYLMWCVLRKLPFEKKRKQYNSYNEYLGSKMNINYCD